MAWCVVTAQGQRYLGSEFIIHYNPPIWRYKSGPLPPKFFPHHRTEPPNGLRTYSN